MTSSRAHPSPRQLLDPNQSGTHSVESESAFSTAGASCHNFEAAGWQYCSSVSESDLELLS